MDARSGRNVVIVKPSRRKSRAFLLFPEFIDRLREDLPSDLFRDLNLSEDPDAQHKSLTAGVKINGRPISVQSIVEWIPYVQIPGGRNRRSESSSSSSPFSTCHIGVVQGFYYLMKKEPDEDFREEVLLLEVKKLEVTGRKRGLYILKTPFGEIDANLPGDTILVHSDSVMSKVKLVPHLDTSEDKLLCGVKMWNVR